MPHHTHSIDRWDDATGSNLYEHLAGGNDLLLARAGSNFRTLAQFLATPANSSLPLCSLARAAFHARRLINPSISLRIRSAMTVGESASSSPHFRVPNSRR